MESGQVHAQSPRTLLGREHELSLVQRGAAPGSIVVITAEPGVGATRLLTEFAHQEGTRPAYWADLTGSTDADWLRSFAAALAVGNQATSNTTQLLGELSQAFERQNPLFCIDGFEVLDEAETTLGRLAQAMPRATFVVTLRRAPTTLAHHQIALQPLSLDASLGLLAAGNSADEPTREWARFCCGNPLALRLAAPLHAVALSPDSLQLDSDEPLTSLVRYAVAALPEEVRTTLVAAVAHGGHFSVGELADLTRARHAQCRASVLALCRAGLIRRIGTRWFGTYAAVRDVVPRSSMDELMDIRRQLVQQLAARAKRAQSEPERDWLARATLCEPEIKRALRFACPPFNSADPIVDSYGHLYQTLLVLSWNRGLSLADLGWLAQWHEQLPELPRSVETAWLAIAARTDANVVLRIERLLANSPVEEGTTTDELRATLAECLYYTGKSEECLQYAQGMLAEVQLSDAARLRVRVALAGAHMLHEQHTEATFHAEQVMAQAHADSPRCYSVAQQIAVQSYFCRGDLFHTLKYSGVDDPLRAVDFRSAPTAVIALALSGREQQARILYERFRRLSPSTYQAVLLDIAHITLEIVSPTNLDDDSVLEVTAEPVLADMLLFRSLLVVVMKHERRKFSEARAELEVVHEQLLYSSRQQAQNPTLLALVPLLVSLMNGSLTVNAIDAATARQEMRNSWAGRIALATLRFLVARPSLALREDRHAVTVMGPEILLVDHPQLWTLLTALAAQPMRSAPGLSAYALFSLAWSTHPFDGASVDDRVRAAIYKLRKLRLGKFIRSGREGYHISYDVRIVWQDEAGLRQIRAEDQGLR